MRRNRGPLALLRNEEGAVLALVAAGIVALLGMAALAIDLGLLFTARSEAQRAADAGAHAGAGVFLVAPGDVAAAREQARAFGESNPVRLAGIEVRDEDIDVIPDSQKVRVRVHRTAERDNPVPTMFARVLGLRTADVGAVAAAQTWPSDGTDCMLPFAIPDRWDVFDEDLGQYRPAGVDDVYDASRGDRYHPPSAPRHDGYYTGYGQTSVGDLILLKPSSPQDTPQPEWYYPIRFPETQGADDFRQAVANCWDPAGELVLGDPVQKEPGNMAGPTRQGFQEILAHPDEQGITWDHACGCPRDRDGNPVGPESRRVRPLVMFHPEDWEDIDQGSKPVPVRNFAGVFIEGFDSNGDLWVRWMQYTTVRAAAEWMPNDGMLLRTLRIVE